MFGVIMVICFTSILRPERELNAFFVDKVIAAALACCLAWGLVDGIFYVWEGHYDQKRRIATVQALKEGRNEEGIAMVAQTMEDTYLDTLDDEERERTLKAIAGRLASSPVESIPLKQDLATMAATFILVVGTAVFVLLPFYLIQDVSTALAISNVLCISVLFGLGYWRSQYRRSVQRAATGLITAVVGIIITAVTVLLGG
jgi:VIT1/CCC1 family predicted Fe2+/Mn2+ transporter